MFSYGFFCVTYCRTAGNFLFTVPCVSFRLIRNTGFWPVSFWRGDLRRRTEISQPPDYRTYSPEVTSLRSNLPVHRIANAPGCVVPVTRVPTYNKGKIPLCQGDFLFCLQNFSSVFVPFADGSASRKPLPCRAGAHAAAWLLASACRDTIPAYSPCPQTAAHCCCRRSRTGTVCLTPSSRWAASPSWHFRRSRSPYTPRPPRRPRRSSPAPPA